MKKQELLEIIQSDLKSQNIILTRKQTEIIYNSVFKNVGHEIANGRNLTIRDFGKFESRYLTRRLNLKEKGTKKIWEIKFAASPYLKNLINL